MIVGVDLAGKDKNASGIAILNKNNIYTTEKYYDNEIIEICKKARIVVFDAPLSLPKGRCCLEINCECSKFGHFRKSDIEIRKYGKVLPLTFRGMKKLVFRAIKLKNIIESLNKNTCVIETHPNTAKKMIDVSILKRFKTNKKISKMTIHEFDAMIAAIVGYFYKKKKYIALGDKNEGTIILPKLTSP
ncbi:Protein of unknown function DUF429 [Methanothermus fervidus DSM 2088]|uniref:DUF429 domain-containing protein n=1 Tax=Methanothermus fervidus (strain ATCC 43054 / DSM 2088 / JCM 10308 / V24 S) TaxID=523846 RepID=E3GYQ3_METFV|nr:hypothetical protein [Methanothermus fervidus]ADP77435.1 Protein of unknown function DUF429 [Methanothermus fervidus DSM 2088]